MTTAKISFKDRFRSLVERIKKLQGDPGYIAMGMAIGVFVGVTPTIPFHTVIAVALAFVLKGSKPAAAIGVWFANPVTIPIFYIGSFKLGTLILNKPIPFDVKFESIKELMTLGLDVTIAMVVGGAILGIIPAIASYFLTYRFMVIVREKAKKRKDSRGQGAEDSRVSPKQ
jgi:uncharacterized protein (DUF2062 family)